MEEDFVFNYRLSENGKLIKGVQMTFCDKDAASNTLNLALVKMQEFLNAIGYDIYEIEVRHRKDRK